MSYLERTLPYVNAFGTVDISKAQTVEEALHMAELDWLVDTKPIYDENGNPYNGFNVNVRQDTGDLLGVVSDKYRIVQNDLAFDFVNDLCTDGFKFDSAGQFRNGKSIWLMGHLEQQNILGDDIDNNIVFVNSHDGSSGVKIMMTPVRVICSNMLNIALKRASRSWATRHTKNIYTKMEEAKYTLGLADNYMKALNVEADRLSNMKITDDRIDEIFNKLFPVDPNKDSERKIKNVSIIKDTFFKCYNEDDIKQFKGTVYGAVNAMADLTSHNVPGRLTSNYYENSWKKLINGHQLFDSFYREVR